MEKLTELRTYRVDLVCAQCEKGYMIHTGKPPADFPPLFPHQCSECGHQHWLDHVYPWYKDVDVTGGQ